MMVNGTVPGSACVSRAGFGVSPKQTPLITARLARLGQASWLIVILNSNPLDGIAHLSDIHLVIRGGVSYPPASLHLDAR